jgi:ABC-type glycerol-3-phosphate transport system substrate-binding protein
MSDETSRVPGFGQAAGTDRRKFLTRAAALGLAAPALGGLLAACSGGDDGFKKGSATATGAAKKYKGRLVMSTISNPPKQAQQAVTDGYKKLQPDVDIVWETQNYSGADAYTTFLNTQLTAKTPRPDFVGGAYARNYSGYVDYDEYVTAHNPYTGHSWDQDLSFTKGGARNALGQMYQVSTEAYHLNWTYNKDMFDKAGAQPPTNWDEFVDVCAKLKAAGFTPTSTNWGYMMSQWMTEIYFDQYHIDWVQTVRAQKGDWNFNPALDGKFTYDPSDPFIHTKYTLNQQRLIKGVQDGTLRFDTPQMAQLVANLAKVFPKYATSDFFVITDAYTPLLKQEVAMLLGSTTQAFTLADDFASKGVAKFNVGAFESPGMTGLVKCKARAVEPKGGVSVSIIKKSTEQTAMAIDFLMYWLAKPGYQPFYDAEDAAKFTVGDPTVTGLTMPADMATRNASIKFVGNAEVALNQLWMQGLDPTANTDLHNLLKDGLQGKITPQQYATQLQKYFQDNLGRMIAALSLTQADIDNPARRPSSA